MATKTSTYAGLPDLSGQVRNSIQWLLNPNFNTGEVDTAAAELNVASGMPGQSQFGQNRQLVLRDSEQRSRIQQANQLLDPFLQRESSENMATQAQAGEDRRLAESGRQAMERLQLSESGQTQRLSMEQAARLREIAAEGEQAMQRLQLSEGGQNTRLGLELVSREGMQGRDIASRETIAREQNATDLARQAIAEAGLTARLTQQQSNELELAILRGDQQRQLQILQEAGLSDRQREALRNSLAEIRLQGQNQLINTREGNRGQIANTLIGNLTRPSTSNARPAGSLPVGFAAREVIPTDSWGNPMRPLTNFAATHPVGGGGGGGGISPATIDALLRQYGITPGSGNVGQHFLH